MNAGPNDLGVLSVDNLGLVDKGRGVPTYRQYTVHLWAIFPEALLRKLGILEADTKPRRWETLESSHWLVRTKDVAWMFRRYLTSLRHAQEHTTQLAGGREAICPRRRRPLTRSLSILDLARP